MRAEKKNFGQNFPKKCLKTLFGLFFFFLKILDAHPNFCMNSKKYLFIIHFSNMAGKHFESFVDKFFVQNLSIVLSHPRETPDNFLVNTYFDSLKIIMYPYCCRLMKGLSSALISFTQSDLENTHTHIRTQLSMLRTTIAPDVTLLKLPILKMFEIEFAKFRQ